MASTVLPNKYTAMNPVGDRVVVKVAKKEVQSAGGILLPDSAQDKPTAGEVTSVSKTANSDGKGVALGDNVVYSKFAGTAVEVKGEEFVLLKEEDCIGKTTGDVSSLKPFSDRLVVRCSEASEATAGGLLLTASSQDEPVTGEVVAVGPGKMGGKDREKMEIAAGSTVMYQGYSGTEMTAEDGTKYIILRSSDILACLS